MKLAVPVREGEREREGRLSYLFPCPHRSEWNCQQSSKSKALFLRWDFVSSKRLTACLSLFKIMFVCFCLFFCLFLFFGGVVLFLCGLCVVVVVCFLCVFFFFFFLGGGGGGCILRGMVTLELARA